MGFTFPRQEEDHSSITGGRIQHAHGARAIIAGQDDVDSSTGLNNFWLAGVIHVPDKV